MKKKTFISLIKCDISQGIVNYWYYFLAAAAVAFFVVYNYCEVIVNGETFSYMDVLKSFFLGVREYAGNEEFQFPTVFMSYLIIPFIVLSFYPSNDFLERAKVIFTRTRKKSFWWYSKCIWLVAGVMVYMTLLYVSLLVFTYIFGGEISFDALLEADGVVMSHGEKILQFIILPAVSTIALGLFQMVISVMTSPVYGVLVQIAQLTLSMIYLSPFLPGNYYMYIRSSFYREDGIDAVMALTGCIVVSIMSITAGRIAIDRKDIL